MRIIKNQTAAVLIDVQDRLFPHMWEKDTLEKNLSILLKGLKALEIPLLITQQYTKGLGPTIPPIRDILGWQPEDNGGKQGSDSAVAHKAAADQATLGKAEAYIEKTAFSCWDEQAFRQALSSLNREFVLLAGIESHVCMLQTAIDLKAGGFTPVVIEDCTSSRRKNDKHIALKRLHAENILISTYESILFELTREAGTDTFKTISRLVK